MQRPRQLHPELTLAYKAPVLAWAVIKAVAFLLNAAVFAIGIARAQGQMAPPDYLYVGLLMLTPVVSSIAIGFTYPQTFDAEAAATIKVAAVLLNLLVLVFVIRLAMFLDPIVRAEQALWLVVLFVAPVANAIAFLPRRAPSR